MSLSVLKYTKKRHTVGNEWTKYMCSISSSLPSQRAIKIGCSMLQYTPMTRQLRSVVISNKMCVKVKVTVLILSLERDHDWLFFRAIKTQTQVRSMTMLVKKMKRFTSGKMVTPIVKLVEIRKTARHNIF